MGGLSRHQHTLAVCPVRQFIFILAGPFQRGLVFGGNFTGNKPCTEREHQTHLLVVAAVRFRPQPLGEDALALATDGAEE